MHIESALGGDRARSALWACPFRPFFLAAGTYAAVVMAAWIGAWFAGWPLPDTVGAMHWHSHEMLFGVITAAIAGFLLTAMCAWTGARPLAGTGLVALFALWLAGRAAMWSADAIPGWLVAALCLAFLPVMAAYAGRVIIAAGNYRNLVILAVVGALWATQVLFHLGLWADEPAMVRRAELAAVMLIVLLMIIIGGRIAPAFTRNWLQRHGRDPGQVRSSRLVEVVTLGSSGLLFALLLAGAPSASVAAVALIAGLANLVRMLGWAGWLTVKDPLMWILHAGYAWIPLGLLLMGLAPWLGSISDSAWLHALGAGAMGTLIIGVMTRVALGHTGRPLRLPAAALPAYLLILVAAMIRVGAGLGFIPYQAGLIVAGTAWIAAFALFVAVYAPILFKPRVDGRPG